MQSVRRGTVAVVGLLAAAWLIPVSAWGRSAPAAPPGDYVIGVHSLPGGLRAGDSYLGAEIERVDRVLGFARVAAPNPGDFLARARGQVGVRYVHADPVRRLIQYMPNDPSFPTQYGPQHVRAPEAWDTTLGDLDAKVCVVDTGVRYTHEEFAGPRWLGGIDFVNGDNDPNDDHFHGTHVAGIAAAGIDNSKGIAGIANVGIYGVKVLDQNGDGTWTDVASGIRWCADNGGPRTVINLSLGAIVGAPELADAVTYAYSQGALIAAAAGNDGPCSNCVLYPAKYPEAIAVTCTTSSDTQCSFSSDGPESELTAPGNNVLSAFYTSDTAYTFASGTSMSTPHVAGVAALVWSEETGLSNVDLRQRLRDNAHDLGAPGWDQLYGYGLVDAKATLDDEVPPPDETVLFENFDDGVANGFTLGGLWHVDSLCSPAPPTTPNYLGYHRSGACDYDTGLRTTGNAQFSVDLTGRTTATLDFMHRFEKENYLPSRRDIMRVQVQTSSGWTTLKEWSSRSADQPAWDGFSIDLTPYAGQVRSLRFLFDSTNATANNFDGWFIDNVEVTAEVPGGNQPPNADAGPDQTVTDTDGSGTESVTLDGTGSDDPDGSITSYEWTEGGNLIGTGASPTVDFSVGTHTVTLTVTDDDTATDTDTVVITVESPSGGVLFSENFDDGTADGFTLGALWHVDSACPPAPPSTPNYLGYHRTGACDFNTGARTTGNAQFEVDLTGQSAATLEFVHRFEKEIFQTSRYDIMRVQVQTPSGWTTLKEWSSRSADQPAWTPFSIDLTSYAGQVRKLRFLFDSVNAANNNFDGWLIDNVEVTGS